MKLINKKKAFTLTELLVVVIVLGALAAVAVPKMNQMLETRKTTEAENVFSAVRTEQEHRCVQGKAYLGEEARSKLSMLNGVNNKNYTYTLTPGGIKAAAANYTLQMPSYKTGEICCSGSGCSNLNKAYPLCETLAAVSADVCVPKEPDPDPEPTPEPDTPVCTNGDVRGLEDCNLCGTRTTEACVDGQWVSRVTPCSKNRRECFEIIDLKSCDVTTRPSASGACNGCGTHTRTVTCNNVTGLWETGSWGSCSKTAAECNPSKDCTDTPPSASQSCGNCGKQTRSVTCNKLTGSWEAGAWSACSGEGVCKPYASDNGGTCGRTCNSQCKWVNNSCGGGGGGGGGGCAAMAETMGDGCYFEACSICIRGISGKWVCPDGGGVKGASMQHYSLATAC